MGANDPEELFCLRWNDYRDNFVTTLSDLRREEDFFDVTLAIDGRQVKAHKLVGHFHFFKATFSEKVFFNATNLISSN